MSLIVRNPRGQFTKVLFKKTDIVFENFAGKVVKQARKNLKKKGKVNSGTLFKSIRATAIQEPRLGFELMFLSTDYGDFINEGVQGKGGFKGSGRAKGIGSPYRFGSGKFGGTWQRFRSKISTWVKQKGIQGRDKGYTKKDGTKVKGTGKFISNKTLTFLIQRSIYQKGLERTLFFDSAFDRFYNKSFINKAENAYAADVETLLAKGMKIILGQASQDE
jgi:hypothetical protein